MESVYESINSWFNEVNGRIHGLRIRSFGKNKEIKGINKVYRIYEKPSKTVKLLK